MQKLNHRVIKQFWDKTEENQKPRAGQVVENVFFLSVSLCWIVITQPSTGLLWSSPGVQLRVTARCFGSVIWRRTGGSGRSKGGNNIITITTCTLFSYTSQTCLNKGL